MEHRLEYLLKKTVDYLHPRGTKSAQGLKDEIVEYMKDTTEREAKITEAYWSDPMRKHIETLEQASTTEERFLGFLIEAILPAIRDSGCVFSHIPEYGMMPDLPPTAYAVVYNADTDERIIVTIQNLGRKDKSNTPPAAS